MTLSILPTIGPHITLLQQHIDWSKTRKSSCMNARHTACRIASARYADLSPDRGGGTPLSLGLGEPILPSRAGMEYPSPPSIWTWDRAPPHLDLGWGTPLSRPGMGYPLSRPGIWFPHLDLGWGTPSRPGMSTPPIQTWDGVNPPPH